MRLTVEDGFRLHQALASGPRMSKRALRARVAFWPGHLPHVVLARDDWKYGTITGIDTATGTYTITHVGRGMGYPDLVIIDDPIKRLTRRTGEVWK